MEDFNLPESILDPVLISTSDANKNVGNNMVQANWSNLADLRGQFVKLFNPHIGLQEISAANRADFYLTTDDGYTVVPFYDKSLRFRNDKMDILTRLINGRSKTVTLYRLYPGRVS